MKEKLLRILESRWMILVIIILSLIMHFRVFNLDLVGFHVWRQAQTQSTILSFAEEDQNILNPRKNDRGNGDGIFRMEFPLSQWLTSLPVRFVGHDVVLSRIFNFLFGLFSLFGIYFLSKRLFKSPSLALAAVWILAFTPVFYYYTLNPMPDNLALTFSIWGLYFFFRWYKEEKTWSLLFMSVFLSLSALCKLPFVLFFCLPAIYILWQVITRSKRFSVAIKQAWILLAGLVPFLVWYIWVIPKWEGNGIVSGILSMDAQQKSHFWYYLWYNLRTTAPELVIGMTALPIFIIGLFSSSKLWEKSKGLSFAFGLWAFLTSGLMIFEMNMIETVHDYYYLPFIPIVVLFGVFGINQCNTLIRKRRWVIIPLLMILLSMPVYAYFRIQPRWERIGFNEDLLIYKEELRAAVPDTALVCAGNDLSHHIFLYYINKKGWVFEQDWMGRQKLDGLIQEGCQYLYCDSRNVDQNNEVQSVFGTKVATFGSINIFQLINPDKKGN